MARVVWVEPALSDLEEIADYIALDDPQAARDLVRRVFRHVEKLRTFPNLGARPPELPRSRYRQIVEPPCRIIYRSGGKRVFILHVFRGESMLRPGRLAARRPRGGDS